jgi:transcriptional regulator with XRE-family HTH domain
MTTTNWYWDLRIPLDTIKEILADERNPRFARVAGKLLARTNDPDEVFSLMTPLAFCRRFRAIQREIGKDEWTKDKAAFWRATYERHLREFRKAGVRVRQQEPREVDPFTRELIVKLRSCRDEARLSQAELASVLGCSQQFVSGIESGRERVTIEYLRKFATAAGCEFDVILRPSRKARAEDQKLTEDYAELNAWVESERRAATQVARTNQLDKCLMEVTAYCPDTMLNARQDAWRSAGGATLRVRQDALRQAMEKTQIHSFGWPIGLVLDRPEFEPKAYQDAIRASILVDDKSQYDYWTLRSDLVFYLLKTLFEDTRSEGKIFLDTRIVRTAETLLRISRLYRTLGVQDDEQVVVRIRYTGLRGRVLTAAHPSRAVSFRNRVCVENDMETSIRERLGNIEPKLVDVVHEAVSELTVLFDYFEPSKEQVVKPIIEQFLKGQLEAGESGAT